MPPVYQQNINAVTKIGVWHITEEEDFFLEQVPVGREITHWHKRLQHLAGRFLLKVLNPDFPVSLIQIADTKKPFLKNEPFHFSISHCGDYAAVIVSKNYRVGVDIELITPKIERIQHKFLSEAEHQLVQNQCPMNPVQCLTLCWSVKESVFKWWGNASIDFKEHIVIKNITGEAFEGMVNCLFKNKTELQVHYLCFNNNILTWVLTPQ